KQILVIIDKTDKIGIDGVKKELEIEGIAAKTVEKLLSIYSYNSTNDKVIDHLRSILSKSPIGMEGISELEYVFNFIKGSSNSDLQSKITIDLTLARGLEYYTGTIFEVKAPEEVKIGSIGGGGRYDDLTGLFG